MLDKLSVLLCVAALATASDLQPAPAPIYGSSTPSPIQYAPVANPSGPAIYTYSSPPAQKGATVEAYRTVTSHPPPSAYKTAPTVAPYDPSKFIQAAPQYVGSPAYGSPIPAIANYPAQGYPGAAAGYIPVPYGSVPNPDPAAPNKYAGRTQIQLVDSSEGYIPGYFPQYPGSVSSPQSIPIPVEYPTAVGKDVGSHVVYAPLQSSEAYSKPKYKPLATYAVQSAYANYAKSVAAYSPAPAVSRVNFNGLGVSYGW